MWVPRYTSMCPNSRLSHALPALQQVAPLDLSGIDLSKLSGQRLKQDHKWTFMLIVKLSLPLLLSIVRDALLWL